jgi:hypothetical protein
VPQQQLREPVLRPHQRGARILPRPDQIPCRFLELARHAYRRQLAQPQQPRQPLGHVIPNLRRHARARNRSAPPDRRPAPPPATSATNQAADRSPPGRRTVRSSPLSPSSTPATAERACRSTPTNFPSLIPAPPVLAALPPHQPRRQPAPTYERGAGQSIRSGRFLCLAGSRLLRSHGGLAHGRVVRRTVDRGGTRRKPVTGNEGVQPSASSRAQLSGASSKTSAGMSAR